ncbi:MAG TPA: SusC/RagA family TonB-linked outer membrane protein [Gemmatimonadaceae bacterium]
MQRSVRAALTTLCAMFLLPALAVAQTGTTISGRVASDAGEALPNASVFLQGTSIGTLTNDDGRYSLTVPAANVTGGSATLTARRIGFRAGSVEITLTSGTITQDFTLATMPAQLQAVVTTALGLQKEKSQLGSAQQQLSTEELNTTRSQNFVDQLQGKVSGLTITGSGTAGGSTKIVIRGANSINGNNTPLFVVDGFPVSNDNRGSTPDGGSLSNTGIDAGSTISDINPDDIETISVLKGPNAAAIYGSRAANGAIIITTKRGRAGQVRTRLNTSYTWERPSILIDWQNLYGQGSAGNFKYVDGKGGGINDNYDQSYGPRLDGRLIDQFTGPQQPWVAHPDNVDSFFETGHNFSTTLAISGGTENANARLSVGNSNITGVIPSNRFHNITGSLGGELKLGDRISTTASLQYARNRASNRPGMGYNTGIMEQFLWFGRQVDMDALRERQYDENGNLFNWNHNFHNNPFWLQRDNPQNDNRERIITSASGTYKVNDWLNATLRAGLDSYNWRIERNFAKGNLAFSNANYAGAFTFVNQYSSENNADFLLNATRSLTSRLSLDGLFGATRRYNEYRTDQTYTSGISVPGIYNVSNAAITPTLSGFYSERQINSVYGSLAFTWDGWWTVEGTARNDWSSTLPKGNNSYFYPSVNTSVVLTDAVPSLASNTLSYLKLRAAYAQVGNDAPPYQLASTYNGVGNKFGSLPQYALSSNIANANLKPELTNSFEIGTEVGFFDNRVTLDASYYDKSTRNQIINLVVSSTGGFLTKSLNAGEIANHGVEALLTAIPVRTNDFEWTTSFNYGRNRSEVVSLAPDLSTVVLASQRAATVEAHVGEPYGALYGRTYLRDEATGQFLLSNGLPQQGPTQKLGNINPDWVGGWNNTFKYKPFTLGFLIDIRQGGETFSNTNMMCEQSGACSNTLVGREVDWNNPGVVGRGIDQATGEANTVNVTSEQWFQAKWLINEAYTYDLSYVKLREVRLGYDLPNSIVNRLSASAANISLVGRNIWTHKNIPNIDPEFAYSSGNAQGFEYMPIPQNRSIGINVQITP